MVFIQVISSGHCWYEQEDRGTMSTSLSDATVLISPRAVSVRKGLPVLSQQVRLAAATMHLGRSYAAAQASQIADATRSLGATV